MFKQYSWAFTALFVLMVAFFAAKITGVYLAKMLEVKRSIGVLRSVEERAEVPRVGDREDYEVILERNIFDSTQSAVTQSDGEAGDVAYVPGGEAVRTSMSLKVLAVLVIGEGKDKRSSATIDAGGGVDVYAVDDNKTFSPGVRLVQIKPTRIEFIRGGRLEYAELLDTMGESIFGPPKPLDGATASKSAQSAAPSGDAIAKVAEGKYAIDGREIENAIQNLDKLYTEIRAVPNFQDGRAAGMKILSVKPGSVFAKLGLKRGDVLQRINGLELDVRRGFEIFNQLKDQKSLTLDLTRGGSNQTVEYEIR